MNSFVNWWQHLPSKVSPEIITIGSFPLRWYSLGYLIAFFLVFTLAYYRQRNDKNCQEFSKKTIEDSLFYIVLGVVLGARFGYIIFYSFSDFLSNPLMLIQVFTLKGGFRFTGITGMSYHGGVIGLFIAFTLYVKKHKLPFLSFVDLFAPTVPLGYFFGRLGNFMNGELYGRITEKKWGMYFLLAPRGQEFLRHPSQLYEAFFEGLFLFAVLWSLRNYFKKPGSLMALYLIGYGVIRFVIEFFRQPDDIFLDPGESIGTVLGIFSMGQVLCFAMILAGAFIFYKISSKQPISN